MADARKLAGIFKVLSADTRVQIVKLLKGRALCVNALASRLGVTQGAVSQHLRTLRDAGVVVPEKRGYYVHYRLDERTIAKWKAAAERFLGTESGSRSCGSKTERKRQLSIAYFSYPPKKKDTWLCPRQNIWEVQNILQ